MPVDRLQSLLQPLSLRARLFHSGPLCGLNTFDGDGPTGQLHLVRRGPLEAWHGDASQPERIDVPSLLLYPRPLAHRFRTDDAVGADMACAHVEFTGNARATLARALPAVVVLPLEAVPQAHGVLDLLFEEAFAQRCGRQAVVDRLFEVVLVLVVRALLERGQAEQGVLAGLAHPRLRHALVGMHDAPADAWSLPRLCEAAGMSRSHFAATFARVVGMPASEYLARHRMGLAQQALLRGRPLNLVADDVGYGSPAALSRAFSAACGMSPRAWLKTQRGSG